MIRNIDTSPNVLQAVSYWGYASPGAFIPEGLSAECMCSCETANTREFVTHRNIGLISAQVTCTCLVWSPLIRAVLRMCIDSHRVLYLYGIIMHEKSFSANNTPHCKNGGTRIQA